MGLYTNSGIPICEAPLSMQHYEINLTVKDVQIMSGFSYSSSKLLLQTVKRFNKIVPKHWLTLQSFCSYVDISYGNGLAALSSFYNARKD